MANLDTFNPALAGRYDPGQLVIHFDGRQFGPPSSENKMSTWQTYWISGLYKIGWPSWETPDLEPGNLRIIWYTHAGNQGTRDHPLHRAYAVKSMYDALADEGFRPMILGFSAENPFPMIGGSEPPPEPKKPQLPRAAKSASASYSGHGGKAGSTPHDRIMAIIEREEEREAKGRREEVEKGGLGEEV